MGDIAPHPRIRLRLSCGQGTSEVWQSEHVSCQIVFVSVLVHCNSMCSRLSVGALHWGHLSRSSRFLIWCQNLPIRSELWVAQNRNACIGFLMLGFRMDRHIIGSVSRFVVTVWMAFLISRMLFAVEFVYAMGWDCFSAAYVSACVDVSSFIPSMLKLSGTDIFMLSGLFLSAPVFTSWLACLLLSSPACPFVHCRYVGAGLRQSWLATAWNHVLLAIPVHPLSSQTLRCFVRLFITYLESDIHFNGTVGSACCSATMRAASSPVWLDWSFPGTLIAQFSGWFSPNHILPPHFAFSFLLLVHDLSV